MAPSRKRGRQEMEDVEPPKPTKSTAEPTLLEQIRNMWEFANLGQWIFIFGRAVKIDENLDIEDLEMEFLKPHSTVLQEIGLALLKFVSSHRGLTPEIFDEYTRRQYLAKAPERNPYGDEDDPTPFKDFDVFTKIRVLQQLTQWTMGNPDRIRERMEEQKDTEQTSWRIEALGWDSEDRTYTVLDDNRLYRQTDPPPPPPPAPKPKKNSKKAKAARRSSKRRKVSETLESEGELDEGDTLEVTADKPIDNGLGGSNWECIAVTLDEYNAFIASIEKSRDANEKVLRKRIVDNVLPLLEKQEEARKRKQQQKERELLNMEKLAHAKRSSRIAGKMELHKQEEEAREAERKKLADLQMAKKEQDKWQKLEKERESRMMTREQRLKEREARRILHEEELANLSEDSKKIEAGEGRLSERHLKAEMERKRRELEELQEEDEWMFDCVCGVHGQVDDGTHSIACEKCNVWQHSKCVGVSQAAAEREDFEFICSICQRKAEDEERAKNRPPIKIKLNRPGSSSSTTGSPLPLNTVASTLLAVEITTANGHQPPSPRKASQNGPPHPVHSPRAGQMNASHGQQQQSDVSLGSSSYTRPYGKAPSNGNSSPLPKQPQLHTFVNGSATKSTAPVTASQESGSTQKVDYPLNTPGHASGPLQPTKATWPTSSGNDQRRHSISMPSPLSSAPVLTPVQKTHQSPYTHPLSSPAFHPTPSLQPRSSPPHPSVSFQARGQENDHSADLPPATTGLSPTKHSPPRSVSNGSFTAGTPSMLPPIALSPSPQHQNLSPPVKPSEPDRHRLNGQPVLP